ncbi:MAG TPA: oxygenase MpaB family protein, partial [Egibacteraceae bacterium]|nr:oxygenase MpaB family protein [Egibacteraceae bacterium]
MIPGQTSAGRPVEPDPGLFGPASVSWRIHGDPAMALGGLRALMLQALHPLAMAGVVQHSQYRDDPWGRLARTGEYMAAITYGTTSEALDAAARIRAVHERIAGNEPESGVAYRADDPDLLLWVHCAGTDSFLTAYRRCGGRLSRADADAYVAEQVRAAVLVGVPQAACPADCRA